MKFCTAVMALTLPLLAACAHRNASPAPMTIQPMVESSLEGFGGFRPLPPEDPALNARLAALVAEVGLAEPTRLDDGTEERSSICVVDLRDPLRPRVAGWNAEAFVYPASSYKLYVLGEAIRQVGVGTLDLQNRHVVAEHNVRAGSRLAANEEPTLSEVLRLMMMYSDNTAANVAIDIVDRENATALMHAMGCQGSEITRKYLPRTSEDPGYVDARGTVSSARHFATFIYAVENGCIGGGKGRGLIKGYMSTVIPAQERFGPGLPASATIYAKGGWWSTYTSQASLIEDGETKYILCVLTAQRSNDASPRMAELARGVHAWMSE
ncbi:MAG: serine hydrolase [Candidatus Sumerlaeia bacterium]|nr:serine hydrolase [Candidatus Sumerlaeia bacterium]